MSTFNRLLTLPLKELASNLGVKDIKFLETMRKMLEDRQNKLELGFKTLLDFKMSYGALIMESIRKDLNSIFGGVRVSSQPETSLQEAIKDGANIVHDITDVAEEIVTVLPEVEKIQIGLEIVGHVAEAIASNIKITDAASVENKLKTLHQQAVDKCKTTLEDWKKAPNRLRFYMAEEFVDRVLYDEGMEEEWRHFLSEPDIRSKVWIEFKQIEDRKQVQTNWLNAVEQVRELNQRQLLEFI